ncbi:MAG TPA: gliding motility-associated C-terminal domain-containing protein, partial [Bacteroidia bacterium]|nr:gliding motility-associated C-terminal domain-containing protein [Bacteroidia bacterium]
LLFYTDGIKVWNRRHEIMKNGDYVISTSADILIIPFLNDDKKYYIVGGYLNCYYAIVDMRGDGGLGEVIFSDRMRRVAFTSLFFVATKHATDNAYWLTTYVDHKDSSIFYSHYIDDTGIDRKPVKTLLPIPSHGKRLGEATTSGDGSLIAISYYSTSLPSVRVFTFDKHCGKVSNPVSLPIRSDWENSFGVCFSPDKSKLYVTYASMPGYLVQYSGPDYQNWEIIDSSASRFMGLQLGPDNKIYICVDTLLNKPSQWIGVIHNPDKTVKELDYTKHYIDLGNGRNSKYRLPTMIQDRSPLDNSRQIINIKNRCLTDTTFFSVHTTTIFDSLRWDFGDTISLSDTSTLKNTYYIFNDTGKYIITLTRYLCGNERKTTREINILTNPEINWPDDSVFCHNHKLLLNTPFRDGDFTWSTQETSQQIKINKKGKYWVKVKLGSCSAYDTISISELPPILIDLGGDYTICDDDNELVQLDAGKGFEHYKWTPTGDTTQWIIVKKAGDYFVVVEDFRGCKGDDGSRVSRLCDFTFYMPNAFTPDGNGLNDFFMPAFSDISGYRIEIFNSWGEKLFESTNPVIGWDGTFKNNPCPTGAYIWKVSYKGHHNKLFKNFTNKGVVNLIR